MIRGSQLLGKTAISRESQVSLGAISALRFDPESQRLVELDVRCADATCRVSLLSGAIASESDRVEVGAVKRRQTRRTSTPDRRRQRPSPGDLSMFTPETPRPQTFDRLFGKELIGRNGRVLGTIVDLGLDERTQTICHYEISNSATGDRQQAPAPSAIAIEAESVRLLDGTPKPNSQRTMSAQVTQQLQQAHHDLSGNFAGRRNRQSGYAIVTGRRVNRLVAKPDGTLLAVPGQYVTPAIVATARRWNMLDELTNAVEPDSNGDGGRF